MQELQLLNERLDMLLKQHAVVQAENKKLKETVARQTKTIEGLNGKLAGLEQQVVAVQIGKADMSEDEKNSLRKQLDGVIGEIDKILASLND